MVKMKKAFIIVIVLLFSVNVFSQIIPSIYTGLSTGTNLGGEAGIGAEFRYKFISVNIAMGMGIESFPENTMNTGRFGVDAGIKLYVVKGLFVGFNYGSISSYVNQIDVDQYYFEKVYGFSYTLGYKQKILKKYFIQAFAGFSSDRDVNYVVFIFDKVFVPRGGVLLGYKFGGEKR